MLFVFFPLPDSELPLCYLLLLGRRYRGPAQRGRGERLEEALRSQPRQTDGERKYFILPGLATLRCGPVR